MFKSFLFCILLIPLFGHSAIIIKIKGNRCFVHLEGASAAVGDHMEALDLFGKPRGIIRLDKVKNGKAIATIVEGKVGVNWLLEHTTQTQLESIAVTGVPQKNKIGLMGSARQITVKKDIRETQRYYGWGGGGSLFFDWSFHKLFTLSIASGLTYYNIDSQNVESRSSSYRNTDPSLRMTEFPSIQMALKFYIPIAKNTKVWIGAGGSFSKWNNINDHYHIFNKNEFKFQPAGQIMLGMDFNLPNTKYTLPISIGYKRVQWGGQWFDEKILGKKPKSDHIALEISEITFHIGIAQPI